jgi:RNA polymerase sigma-70 factor (ECF subfamily)
MLRPDRRYERMEIRGLMGITEAQKTTLLALGAVEDTSEFRPITSSRASAASSVQRRIIQLRFIEDLSIAQIAARMAQSDGAVKMILHRAIQRLRRHWLEGAI